MDVPMPLCQLVYLTFLSAAVCSLPEGTLEGLPYNLQMDSHNFQHTLSWQAEQDPAVPASYNVLYRDRRRQSWMSAEQCSGIAQLSCELTQEFSGFSGSPQGTGYFTFVQNIGGTQVLNSSVLYFEPFTQTILGPPEVNITSCPNCINVTIKLPASHFRDKGKLLSLTDLYGELHYNITLKSLNGEHKRPRQKTTEEVFSTVIEDLYPSRNYCVSVVVTASTNKHFVPSPWVCVTAGPEAGQGYSEVIIAVAGAVCVSLMIVAVLKCVHAAGFILPKISLPLTLACIKRLAYSPWVSESESVDSVEVIPREVKRRARGCSDSSDSDSSDSDSSALGDHDYTRRAGPGRASVPRGSGTPCPLLQYSGSSSCELSGSQAGDEPAAEPHEFQERQGDPAGGRASGSEFPRPLSEGSCGSRGSGECFTISLNTVLLGTLEHGHGSAAAPPAQEEPGDWHCAGDLQAKLLEDTGSAQGAPCSDFHEWQKSSSSSEESDSLDSDTEPVTGYMRR